MFLLSNTFSNRILSGMGAIGLALVLGLTITSFFRGFDLTDEGYHLLHLINGADQWAFAGGHVPLHYLGALFSHGILGYRFTNLVLVMCGPAFFSWAAYVFLHGSPGRRDLGKVARFAFMPVMLGLILFADLTPTPSYNSLSVLGLLLSAGAALFVLAEDEDKARRSLLGLTALAVLAAVLAKPTAGLAGFCLIAAMFALEATLVRRGDWKTFSTFILIQAAVFAGFFMVFGDLARSVAGVISILSETSTPVRWTLYVYGHGLWLLLTGPLAAVFGVSALFYAGFRVWSPRRAGVLLPAYLVAMAALLLSPFVLWRWFGGASLYHHAVGADYLVAIAILGLAWKTWMCREGRGEFRPDRKVALFGICLALMYMAGMGSNIVLEARAMINLAPAGVILAVLLEGRQAWLRIFATAFTVLITALYVWAGAIASPYRSAPHDSLTARSSQSDVLEGVTLEPGRARVIDALIEGLKVRGFEPARDRIFAAYHLPGLIAAAGARSWGGGWVSSPSLPGGKVYIQGSPTRETCRHLAADSLVGVRHVYVVLNGLVDAELVDCMFRHIQGGGGGQVEIGTLTDPDSGEVQTLMLSGPFRPKAMDARR